ncbi:MAG TPA: hypothetical protein VIS07_22730 [Candidatus Binatia bacterium]
MIGRAFLAATLVVALATPAAAGMLATPVMFRGTNTVGFACEAVNVGSKPIKSVTVRIVPFVGPVNPVSICTNLSPGSVCFVSTVEPAFQSGHCRIEFTGGKQNVRGSMSVVGSGNNVLEQIPAL